MIRKLMLAAIVLISLTSCKSRKAIDFQKALDQQERNASNVLVGKDGPAEEKLACLIKKDFKGALRAIDREQQAFNKIIGDISALPTAGIPQGDELKAASVSYYKAVRDLQGLDREEVTQREASYLTDTARVRQAQDSLLQLSREKLNRHAIVREQGEVLYAARQKFRAANKLE
ncbi:hypothetical protein [Chitinophaga lutea]|nr:hypothetical protein [Chitinophaga lutea]